MEVSFWFSLIISIVSLALSITIGIYSRKRKNHPGAIPFAVILFSESLWIAGFICEMLASSLQARVFWDLFQWLFLPIAALALVAFTSAFSNLVVLHEKRIWLFFQSLSLIFIILILTNPLHGLVISNPRLVSSPVGLTLLYDYTLLDYCIFAFLYGALFVSFLVFIMLALLSQKVYRLQSIAILIGLGILIAGSIYSLRDISLFFGQRDNTPVTFGISNLIFAWVLFRHQLFDVGTVAHSLMVETINDPVVVLDNFNHIVDFNSAAQRHFGFPPIRSLRAGPDTLPRRWQQLFAQFRNTDSFREVITINSDDVEQVLDLTISQILNKRNVVQGRLFFLRDITAQRQADLKIRAGEESYTRLFNTVKEAIYVLSSDGVFLDVNEGAVKMYGYTREEFAGKTPEFVSAPGKNDLKAISTMLDRVFKTGISEEFEFSGRRKNGDTFPKECIANKGTYFGRDVIITTARDVTERKQIELKLREHAEELNLINTLNNAFNRGESLEAVIKLLSDETRRMFACDDAVLFLRSEDGQHLVMQYTTLSNTVLTQVESVIGRKIPPLHIPIEKTRIFKEVLETGQSTLINDPQAIHTLLHELALTASLSDPTRAVVQKLIPQITRVLNFKSTILVPLNFRGKAIGILDLAGHNHFTEEDLRRVESFSPQITIAIQRKQTEEALLQSEAKFRGFFETSADALFLFDENGYTIEINQAAERLFQMNRSEILGKPIWQIMEARSPTARKRPEIESLIRAHLEETAKTGISSWNNRSTESEIQLLDGSIKQIQKMVFAIPYKESSRFGTSIRDITDRKQAEVELQRSSDFIRAIADNTPALVAYWTRDLRCTFANKAYLQWFGRTPEDMNGIDMRDFLGEELFQKNEPYIRAVLQGEDQRFERTLTKHNGEIGHTWAQYISHKSDGEVQGFFVLVTDITALKKSQEALLASADQWKRLFSILPVGVSVLDAHRNIIDMNSALEKILRITQDGLRSGAYRGRTYLRSDNTIMPLEEFPSVRAMQEQSIVRNIEMGMITEDNDTIWTEVSAAPLSLVDKTCVVVTNDITARKLTEIERGRLVAELESKNTELERFSYAVSHDLKAPLFTIQGFVGFLEKDILAGNSERIKNDITRITTAIEKMQQLLNQLLELSRAGRIMNPLEEISLDVIVHDAVDLVAGRVADKHVAIEIAPDLPVIYCDRVRLTQVMQNLIDNAIKFMGKQPKPCIWIGQRTEKAEPIFFVRDNGIGITQENMHRVFSLFDKLDLNAEGTGLGLALIKRIIEAHGGKIWIESEGLGKGSTFCFTIPNNRQTI